MSKKRSDRNNKKVLKALRQKKTNGGRAKFDVGGRSGTNWYDNVVDGAARGPGSSVVGVGVSST